MIRELFILNMRLGLTAAGILASACLILYLSEKKDGVREDLIILHEQMHQRRRDPVKKIVAYFLLAVYWYHPIVRVSYYLFCRDIEYCCDEAAAAELTAVERAAYCRTLLLSCAEKKEKQMCVVSFGIGPHEIRNRIRNLLSKGMQRPPAPCTAITTGMY